MDKEQKAIIKFEKARIRSVMIVANREPMQLWFEKKLVADSGMFWLKVAFNKINNK